MHRGVVAGAAAMLGAGLLAVGLVAAPGYAAGSAAARDFRLADPRISESSGLACSVRHPHVVWTTNDSGDRGRVFAVDARTGRTVGVHTFGAPVRDVEALAVTPAGRVLVGDIGDNTGTRRHVTVYWFDEPALGTTSGGWSAWDLAYPDGPHDAESLAVDPRTGRVVVVTKGASGAVYALPARPSRTRVNRLVRLGAGPAVATDAVYLPDGSALAVRTYTRLWLLDSATWRVSTSAVLPLQPQGETLAVDPEGPGLLVGSEGRGLLVQHVDIPAAATSTPSGTTTTAAPRTPEPAAASARPSASTKPGADASRAVGRVAAVAAGLLALGLAVAFARRRRR